MLRFLYIDVIFVKVIYEHNEIESLFYQFFTNVIFSRNIICKQSMTRALFKKQKKCHSTSNPFLAFNFFKLENLLHVIWKCLANDHASLHVFTIAGAAHSKQIAPRKYLFSLIITFGVDIKTFLIFFIIVPWEKTLLNMSKNVRFQKGTIFKSYNNHVWRKVSFPQ